MQRLLLTLGLACVLRILHALELLPAQPEKLVGEWHILRWMGSPMIPGLMMASPPPPQVTPLLTPFWMELSKDSLVIKVKLMQPAGDCAEMETALWKTDDPTVFMAEKQQQVHIWAMKMKGHYIMHSKKTEGETTHMMMLIGHTVEENPEAAEVFEELVESKGLDKAGIVAPPHAAPPDPCMSHHR